MCFQTRLNFVLSEFEPASFNQKKKKKKYRFWFAQCHLPLLGMVSDIDVSHSGVQKFTLDSLDISLLFFFVPENNYIEMDLNTQREVPSFTVLLSS